MGFVIWASLVQFLFPHVKVWVSKSTVDSIRMFQLCLIPVSCDVRRYVPNAQEKFATKLKYWWVKVCGMFQRTPRIQQE